MISRTIKFVINGNTEADCDRALDEALRRMRSGNTSGYDHSDDSDFSFDVSEARTAGAVAQEDDDEFSAHRGMSL